MLPKPPRTGSGHRVYGDDALRRIHFIKRAQEIGFSLREIRELLGLRVEPGGTCNDVRNRAVAKASEIDRKRKQLAVMKKALMRLVAACDCTGPASQCSFFEHLGNKRRL